ncbi:hypothetical protein CNECB9_750019 [Cupriavidus necator]|uniref:Uncharacterized protein n=1 Tax=Cupriavidus necator TaxID=106590 RepID=A0A1K0IRN2_CUPNE|nr:hypothetical protein CNECB9_750019 [Cupriavidus necator]
MSAESERSTSLTVMQLFTKRTL